ncbi:hypothetical protein PV760_21365 [Paenarthrobacter sp. CC6]|jgi:hypothetical protein|uniref:hypothetical protein n=1 Tax=Paenarthrobacter sp. CC6 TaxID=3029184 RepID=UPI00339D1109
MSYDLAVFGSEALLSGDVATRITNIRGLTADLDPDMTASCWSFRVFRGPKRIYSFTVEGPYEDSGEDTPETYAEMVVFGIKYRYDILIEGDGDASGVPSAQAFAKKLAKSVSGFAMDLQTDEVWPKPRKPAPSTDWYDSPDWSDEAKAEFEEKLRSVPGTGSGYLHSKAIRLQMAGELKGASELWLRVLDDTDEFVAMSSHNAALEGLGDIYAKENPELSAHYYRRLLAKDSLQMTTGMQAVKLAQVLITRGETSDLEEAAALLERWAEGPDDPFAVNNFRWNMAVIHLAQAIGDQDAARKAARRGLDLLGVGPQFPAQLCSQKCRGVHVNDETVDWLQQIAE